MSWFRRVIISFLILSATESTFAQSFYYSDTTTISFPSGQIYYDIPTLGLFDLATCSVSNVFPFSPYYFSDLTSHPNGNLYGFGYHKYNPGEQAMCRILFPGSGSIFLLSYYYQDSVKALTCTEEGTIFAAGKGLSTFDVNAETFNYLGDFPSGMEAAGDLAFYKGKLYMTTVSNTLVEVDTINPANSVVSFNFPPGTPPIHGLAAYPITCDSSIIYAIGTNQVDQKIYRIDFENQTLIEICDSGLFIQGVAAIGECVVPACQVNVSLDFDNSSGAPQNDYFTESGCNLPIAISDIDVFVSGDLPVIDSIIVELSDIQNLGDEYLSITSANGIAILGSGTEKIVLVNNGNASFSDFEEALSGIAYSNAAVSIMSGTRQVMVTAWSQIYSSQPAISHIFLENLLIEPQFSINEVKCYGENNGSITIQGLGGHPPYQYFWSNGETDSIINNLTAGTYAVTVIDITGCEIEDSIIISEPNLLIADIQYSGLPAICDNSAELMAEGNGGTTPYSFEWSNGIATSINDNIGPGTYDLTVTDSNGCQAFAEYTVATGDTVLVVQFEEICEGDSFVWGGNIFYSDTMACEVVVLPNGCDSSYCLSLKTNPLPQIELMADGDFCTSNEIAISAGQYNSFLWSTGEISPSILVTSPGAYSITVTNGYSCEASDTITISPGIEFDYSAVNPTCFGDKNGSIVIDNVSGGNSPWRYSIDGINFFPDGAFENLEAGNYLLTIEDVSGCRKEVPVVLEAPSPIFVEAGDDKEIKIGESVTLAAVTNIADPTASWQPPDFLDCTDCLVVNAQPLETIQYEIEVWDENGCMAKDSVTIFVDPATGVYIPNAFSPNGDGINDEFRLFTDSSVERIRFLRIFDRWGELVFEKLDFPPGAGDGGWDGNIKGKAAPVGIYVFFAEVIRIDGVPMNVSGEVNLIR